MFMTKSKICRQFLCAGVGVGMIVAATSGAHAQSGPFSGFAGNWSGDGTVALSDGSKERIKCRAVYKVDHSGKQLEQSLRCASDSYKIDLSSNVASVGNNAVNGTWSEANRNINGNLQGKVSAGRIDIFVEAAGFAATLLMTTRGGKQTVSINSKGEIRDVSINLSKT